MEEIWTTAYKAVQFLDSEGFKTTQKTLSIWKKEGRIKVNAFGCISLDEIRKILIDKKNNLPIPKPNINQNKKTVINKAPAQPKKETADNKNFALIKLKGDAMRARINAKKAQVDYEVSRGNLLERELLTNYINASISVHNDRILNMPRKLANRCIALVRSNKNDAKARIKLEQIFNQEISGILESEKKEIKKFMKRKTS
ncbi:hypothetical protein KAR91_13255 [Candidatus Pacearchaeota archaeon]|nr:hypothetical protein [Candidatus Pacearchaeota archaeon]